MSYAVIADLNGLIPQDDLIRLTDDDDSGSVDADVVNGILANASEIIDTYIAGEEGFPFTTPPPVLKICCIRLAGYDLHARRGEVPETWTAMSKWAYDYLQDVKDGEISLGSSDPEPAGAETMKVDAADKLFSREELDKY